jgi:lysozyme
VIDLLKRILATPAAAQPGQDLEALSRAQLRRDEGEKLYAYTDTQGYLTIGIGRLIDKRKGGGISAEESAYLFSNDFNGKLTELRRRLPWFDKLDVARQGVLLNMAFQMGVDGLLGFKNTLAMVERGDFKGAAAGMLESLWAKQTPERAKRLSVQMETGIWQ